MSAYSTWIAFWGAHTGPDFWRRIAVFHEQLRNERDAARATQAENHDPGDEDRS